MAAPKCDIWVCDGCGQPNLIERDGFFEGIDKIEGGDHPEPEVQLACWVCGFDDFTRVTYVPEETPEEVDETWLRLP